MGGLKKRRTGWVISVTTWERENEEKFNNGEGENREASVLSAIIEFGFGLTWETHSLTIKDQWNTQV